MSRWGSPTTIDDLSQLFLSYLHSTISSTPFSPSPLFEESRSILPHLERLTSRRCWTVFSQPAIDSVPSTDSVFGWGPAGGFVFQKCFVEFFADKNDVDLILDKIDARGEGWVNYFAAKASVSVTFFSIAIGIE